ncbi:hypothetical protein FRB95_005120 [Tulasnella sp. JGI-2019a]|nr:hypothetical protein FRB95_005120 [Tulasnella sp. JGI-2019a]
MIIMNKPYPSSRREPPRYVPPFRGLLTALLQFEILPSTSTTMVVLRSSIHARRECFDQALQVKIDVAWGEVQRHPDPKHPNVVDGRFIDGSQSEPSDVESIFVEWIVDEDVRDQVDQVVRTVLRSASQQQRDINITIIQTTDNVKTRYSISKVVEGGI